MNSEERIKTLEKEILLFNKQEEQSKNRKNKNNKIINLSVFYNIIAELLGGVITAFILNKIYVYFFGKNALIFTLLLLLCSIAGLYNIYKIFVISNNKIEQKNKMTSA